MGRNLQRAGQSDDEGQLEAAFLLGSSFFHGRCRSFVMRRSQVRLLSPAPMKSKARSYAGLFCFRQSERTLARLAGAHGDADRGETEQGDDCDHHCGKGVVERTLCQADQRAGDGFG